LKKVEGHLKRNQRNLARKRKGSSNYKKAKVVLARTHMRVANLRKDFLHKMTSKLCSENQAIVLEDLNVAGMLKNHSLAKHISDASFSEIRRMFEYKSHIYDVELHSVDRFFPSSKACSCCGMKNSELKLSDRTFKCPVCGFEMDRDLNAAKNLLGRASPEVTLVDTGTSRSSLLLPSPVVEARTTAFY
jgi:putative transposase